MRQRRGRFVASNTEAIIYLMKQHILGPYHKGHPLRLMDNGVTLLLLLLLFPMTLRAEESGPFRVAFLTDIHLDIQGTPRKCAGFRRALEVAKGQDVDLMILGGDLADLDRRLPEDYERAGLALDRIRSMCEETGIPTYYTIGNHDRYFYREDGKREPTGVELFEKHLSRSTYSFDHKGVHFMVINSVIPTNKEGDYSISQVQMRWIREDLEGMPEGCPLIVVTHVPIQSLYYAATEGKVSDKDLISNFKPLWDLLTEYHTVAVLQGHNHVHEELFSHGTWLLMGGAVSGAWWQGPLDGTEEGFLLLTLDPEQDRYSWEYIDDGWEQ